LGNNGVVAMNENEWTKTICDRLKENFNDGAIFVDTLCKIPYSQEIVCYDSEWNTKDILPSSFETDLVIYEKNDTIIKPRVVIEAKLGSITTHDAITYSYKAEKHKYITPYLRYGIMIGNRSHYPLPGRLYRHGTNFDFMFSFSGMSPDIDEWISFVEMLAKEISYSRTTEEMLHESRSKDRKRYYMLQKQLIVKEIQ